MRNVAGWSFVVGSVGALVLCFAGCVPAPGSGDEPPATDIWLVDLAERDDTMAFGTPVNLTDRDGYDNQPAFLHDGSAFLYASRDAGQVDVWRYRFDTGRADNITRSPESEYSPAPIPDADGFSVVRVEADGDQRLWAFEGDAADPTLLIEWEDEVEYHAWIDAQLVAIRLRGSPDELKFADPSIGWVEREPIARSVGRTFNRVPQHNAFTFVHRLSSEEWWITQLDLLTRETFGVVRTLHGIEDFVWTPSGALLAADGAKLYRYRPRIDDDWVEVADFSGVGVAGISRLAVDPAGARLLFVASRTGPETAAGGNERSAGE